RLSGFIGNATAGEVRVGAGERLTVTGGANSAGTITADAGGIVEILGPLTTTGAVDLTGGTLKADSIVNGVSGRIAGRGVIRATRGSPTGCGTGRRLARNANDLIIDYTGASPPASVGSQTRSCCAAAAWSGNGLTSSAAAAAGASPRNVHIAVARVGGG